MMEQLTEPAVLETVALVLTTAAKALAANPVAAAIVGGIGTVLGAVAVAKRKKKTSDKNPQ